MNPIKKKLYNIAGENFKDFVSRSDGFSGKLRIFKNFVRRILKKNLNCNKINPNKFYIIMKKLSQMTDFSITHLELNLIAMKLVSKALELWAKRFRN